MVAIVTDSSVGYSTAEITSRGILSVVPLNYQLGGYFYEENASDKNGDFLPLMARLSPLQNGTACAQQLYPHLPVAHR